MPWKERSVMEERLRFVARLLEGEEMSQLCRESRHRGKTGYEVLDRYQEHGWRPCLTVRGGRCAMPTSCRGLQPTANPLGPGVLPVRNTLLPMSSGWPSDAGRRGKELNLRPLPCVRSTLPLSYPPSEGMFNKSAGQRAICWTRCLGPKAQSHVMPERLPPTSDLRSERTRINQQAIAGLGRQL
jgi:hypothetical protein